MVSFFFGTPCISCSVAGVISTIRSQLTADIASISVVETSNDILSKIISFSLM